MFNIFIDFFRVLAASFSTNSRKRLIAGTAAAVLLLSVVFAAFTAWVSMPRYADILQGLSKEMAWGLSIAIAATMYFLLSIIGADVMRATRYKSKVPEYFYYVCIVALCLGAFDVVKNFEGSTDRARIDRLENEYTTGAKALPFADEIAELKAEKAAIYKRYTWKGTTYFAKSKYHPEFPKDRARMDAIEASLTDLQGQQRAAIASRTKEVERLNGIAANKEKSSETGLQYLSLGIYLIQLILAFCWTSLSARLSEVESINYEYESEPQALNPENPNIEPTQPAQAQRVPAGFTQSYKRVKPEELTPEKVQILGTNSDDILRAILQKLDTLDKGTNSGSMTPSFNRDKKTYLHADFDQRDAQEARTIRTEKSIKLRDEAKELKRQGLTISQIAKKLKRSERTIKRYLKQ